MISLYIFIYLFHLFNIIDLGQDLDMFIDFQLLMFKESSEQLLRPTDVFLKKKNQIIIQQSNRRVFLIP